jgi:hypothetical protein
VSDTELEGLYKFPTWGLTTDAAKLGQAFGVFYSDTCKAFTENPNVDASWAGKGSSYRSALARAG